MNLGDWEDVQGLNRALGDDAMRQTLHESEVGHYNERSWAYWHYRLGLVSHPGQLPPLPDGALSDGAHYPLPGYSAPGARQWGGGRCPPYIFATDLIIPV